MTDHTELTDEEWDKMFQSLKPGDTVIETTPNHMMQGMRGTIYISQGEMTKGTKCVMWEPFPGDGLKRMGTSVTHGTRPYPSMTQKELDQLIQEQAAKETPKEPCPTNKELQNTINNLKNKGF